MYSKPQQILIHPVSQTHNNIYRIEPQQNGQSMHSLLQQALQSPMHPINQPQYQPNPPIIYQQSIQPMQPTYPIYQPAYQPIIKPQFINQPIIGRPVINQPIINQPIINRSMINQPMMSQSIAVKPTFQRQKVVRTKETTSMCKYCKQETNSIVNRTPGKAVVYWILFICLFTAGLLFFLPFLMDGCKDTMVICAKCNQRKHKIEAEMC